ncbi:MAG: hypothetical protein ABH860_02990 [bacterium]
MAKSSSKAKPRSFSFEMDKKRLIEFSKMPIVARLNWLEEANQFINSVGGRAIRKRWDMLRSGKV